MPDPDDAYLDGCDLDFVADRIPDGDAAAWVLFADVAGDAAAVTRREAEWRELFDADR